MSDKSDATEDSGVRIGRRAKELTHDQLSEMICIHQLELWHKATRTPIMSFHQGSNTYKPLIADGLVHWKQKNRRLGIGYLTVFGQRVMFARIEQELKRAGVWPKDDDGTDD